MKKSALLILSIFLLVFSSCSSITTLIGNDLSGLPSWVSNPPEDRFRISFVGFGSSDSAEGARQSALRDVLGRISQSIGRDAYTLYYREIASTGRIESLGGNVERNYQTRGVDGEYRHYLLLTLDDELYQKERSEEYGKMVERDGRIDGFLSEAVAFYRENRDVDAFDSVLDALLVTLEGDVLERDHESGRLLDVLLTYLDRMMLDASVDSNGNIEVSLERRHGILHPPIVDAPVRIRYTRSGIFSSSGIGEMVMRTNDDGRYVFSSSNPYIVRGGDLMISIDLDYSKLERIEEGLGESFLSPLWALIDEKVIFMNFEGDDEEGAMKVFAIESDSHGIPLDWNVAVDGMNEYFKSTGVEIDVEKGTGEDEEMVSGYFASSGSSETVAIVHLNQDDVVFTSGRYLVYVTGSVRLYDRNGNLTDETDSLGAVGEGASLPVALSEAFRQAGVNASMLLLSFL